MEKKQAPNLMNPEVLLGCCHGIIGPLRWCWPEGAEGSKNQKNKPLALDLNL